MQKKICVFSAVVLLLSIFSVVFIDTDLGWICISVANIMMIAGLLRVAEEVNK